MFESALGTAANQAGMGIKPQSLRRCVLTNPCNRQAALLSTKLISTGLQKRFNRVWGPARGAPSTSGIRSSQSPTQLQAAPNGTNGDPKDNGNASVNAKLMASLGIAGGLLALVLGGVLMKDQIKAFLDLFIHLVDRWGPLGYIAYIVVYSLLELLAVPAIPLTMTAGAIFGVVPGTMVVSVAATGAATAAFLIARYVARDKVSQWAEDNPKFKAIDKAIGKNGFKVVTLLRLSPLLPLAASNYLYGLTSVDLGSYVAGSWLGMLPGTFAYVTAGTYGKELLTGGGLEGAGLEWWQIAAGLGATVLAVAYVGRIATKALKEYEEHEGGSI